MQWWGKHVSVRLRPPGGKPVRADRGAQTISVDAAEKESGIGHQKVATSASNHPNPPPASRGNLNHPATRRPQCRIAQPENLIASTQILTKIADNRPGLRPRPQHNNITLNVEKPPHHPARLPASGEDNKPAHPAVLW